MTGVQTCALPISTRAISVISAAGQPFHDATADAALFTAIRDNAKVPVEELDEEINSPAFARACAEKLLALMGRQPAAPGFAKKVTHLP